jgi:hypothetical protein
LLDERLFKKALQNGVARDAVIEIINDDSVYYLHWLGGMTGAMISRSQFRKKEDTKPTYAD